MSHNILGVEAVPRLEVGNEGLNGRALLWRHFLIVRCDDFKAYSVCVAQARLVGAIARSWRLDMACCLRVRNGLLDGAVRQHVIVGASSCCSPLCKSAFKCRAA